MGNRRIDWESVERDYSAGMLTVEECAKKHGVAFSSIRRVAKEKNWRRDLSPLIQARAAQKIAAIDVEALIEESANQSAAQSAVLIQSAVEMAATVQANIIIKHRGCLGRDTARAMELEKRFDALIDSVADIRDLSVAAQIFKSMVDSKSKLIIAERQAYKIDDLQSEEDKERKVNIDIQFV